MDTPGGVDTILNIQGTPLAGDDSSYIASNAGPSLPRSFHKRCGDRKGHDTEHAWDMEMCPLLKTITNKESGGTVTWHVLQV